MLKSISLPLREIINRKSGLPPETSTNASPAIIGRLCEQLASKFLATNGYEIIERNWRCREGELDIIARRLDTLVIVEVKARQTKSAFHVRDSVSAKKLKQLYSTARLYLHSIKGRTTHRHVRFDVVRISYSVSPQGTMCCTLDHVINVLPYGIEYTPTKKTYIRW